jgi:hypothetical protein
MLAKISQARKNEKNSTTRRVSVPARAEDLRAGTPAAFSVALGPLFCSLTSW